MIVSLFPVNAIWVNSYLTLTLSPEGRGDLTEGCRGFTAGHNQKPQP